MSSTIHYFDECVVCNEPNPSCFFKPCNHKCICTMCAKTYTKRGDLQTCPLCREKYCAIERDDSKPKNASLDEDEQLAIALRLSLQESEAKRKTEEEVVHQQTPLVDLGVRQESEFREHKRILSSIVDMVRREASRIENRLRQSFPMDTRGSQFAREQTELLLIQNVENAFSRIKESIKLRRSIQMDEWRESPESPQGSSKHIYNHNQAKGCSPGQGEESLTSGRTVARLDSSIEEACSAQSSQAASSSTGKTYANLVKMSPVGTNPVKMKVPPQLSKATSLNDLRLNRGNFAEVPPSQQSASITFNEIIDFTVTDESVSSVLLRPHGFMSLYFSPQLAIDVAVTNKKFQKFEFQVRKPDSIENIIIHDGLLTELRTQAREEGSDITYSIEQDNLITYLEKAIKDAPERPHYRVTVARYEIERELIDIKSLPIQLELKVNKKKSGRSTLAECSVKYQCNLKNLGSGTRLQNVQITLYSDVDFVTLHSQPACRKSASSVAWNVGNPEGDLRGEFKTTLDFSNLFVPSQMIVEFDCEGLNLFGVGLRLNPLNKLPIQKVLRKFKLKKQFQCAKFFK